MVIKMIMGFIRFIFRVLIQKNSLPFELMYKDTFFFAE